MVILQSHVDGDTRVELDDANLIAEEVLDGFRRMYPDSDKAALLTGTTSSGPGFKDLRIHKLQNEILFGLHVPDPDDDDDDDDDTTDNTRGVRGERRYQISWHTSFGELEGKFQQTVTLPALQRDGDEFDGLAAYDADGGRGKNVLEGLDELRKRVQDLESRLRLKERDLTRFRDDVLRVVLP